MKIAILGPGAIGATFAFQLARAGHEVTVIGRGKRLEQLERDRAIVKRPGERVPVAVAGALDATTPWDLVLVTVLAHQVEAVLPALSASSAKAVMFMFNTFEALAPLRDAVGEGRFMFGFPAMLATLEDGKLTSDIVQHGLLTTVTDATWAQVFTAAGIPTVVEHDMESWLRTHAAMIVPFMIAVGRTHERESGLSWDEASTLARAMDEGFRLVVTLGNKVTPSSMVAMSRLPPAALAGLLWTATRVPSLRRLGALGYGEARALIEAMAAVAPDRIPTILSVRP